MITDRLKELIFKKLYKDLSKVEIIPYSDNIWFIDRENKYWYLEYKKRGDLWWRYKFFDNFFHIFSLERSEYEPLICEWVEEVLNRKVIKPAYTEYHVQQLVEEVLNRKVIKPPCNSIATDAMVEEVLNCKVITPRDFPFTNRIEVDEVLNCKVIAPTTAIAIPDERVDEVLNCKVVTSDTGWDSIGVLVEEVLNHKVIKSFSPPFMERRGIEEVLNYKVTTLCPQEIASSDILMEESLNCNVSFTIDNHE